MVDQTQSNGLRPIPVRDRPIASAAAVLGEATRRRLLLVGIILLMTPGTINLAGVLLSPYRVFLIAIFPLLVRGWLAGAGGRPNTVDLLVLFSTGWTMLDRKSVV